MKLSTFWVVRDPSPVSTLGDICWESTTENLLLVIIGSHAMGRVVARENFTIYTEEEEACHDAIARMAKIRATTP